MVSPDTAAQAMVLGLTVKDVVTAVLVPAVAVLTTLIVQDRQQVRERRTQILRALLATRRLPADPGYNAAINLIPVEFNRAKKVMAAWSEYIKQVRFKPMAGDEMSHNEQVAIKQTKLITAIMAKLRMSYSEADLQADAYVSTGFVERDNIYLDSLRATRDCATAMSDVAKALNLQVSLLWEQMGKPSGEKP